MDIVTHGMVGVLLAAPLAESHPIAAGSLLLGSVLPDLDALSRLAGKRAAPDQAKLDMLKLDPAR